MMCVLQLLLLFGTGTTLFGPALASNGTNAWQYTIPDGGQEEIQCMPNNANASIIRWEVFGKILGQPMNSSNAEGLSNFNISKNSSLIVTNPRNSSLQGLVNVTCIASSNNTMNESRIIYRIAFFKVPKITNSKFTYDVPDNGSTKTTFTCGANGFPLPKIQWKFENVTLPAGNAYFVNTTDIPGANLTASNDGGLEVMSANRHGGFGVTVVCFANNTDGNTERNFLVRFLKAPKILTNESNVAIRSESKFAHTFPCETIGYPRPFIQWVLDDKVTLNATSPEFDGFQCLISLAKIIQSSYKVYENGSLVFYYPYCEDERHHENFTCVATSFLGRDTKSHAFFIGDIPKITNSKFTYDVPDDGSTTTTFSCRANGFPLPKIQWVFENVTLPAGNAYFVNTTDIPGANLTASNDGGLEVTSANRHGGFGVTVVCFANNTNGNTERNFLVRFLKAPEILTKEHDIVIPSGRVDRVIMPCQTIGYPRPLIQWMLDGKVTLNATSPELPGKNCLIEFLPPKYLLSSYKVYDNGSLFFNNPHCKKQGEYKNFTCVARSFLGRDTKSHMVAIGNPRSYSFDITLVNASQFGNQDDIKKEVEGVFKDSKDSLSFYEVTVTFVNATSGKVILNVTLFEEELEGKGYILSDESKSLNSAALAKVVHDKLIESDVDVDKFLMLGAKPGPPTHLSVNDVAEEEISFSWKKPDYFDVIRYQIQTNDGGSVWKNRKQASGDKTSLVLDGLDPGTKYLIRMESINAKGTGLPSEQIQAETDDTALTVRVEIIVVVVILVVLGLLAVVAGVRYYRYRPPEVVVIEMDENNPYFQSIPGVQVSNIYERDNMTFCPILVEGGLQVDMGSGQALVSWREITRESLTIGDELGHGEFGIVKRATWLDDQRNTKVPVAVKTIKENATESERKDLFKELKLMAEVSNHVNIVNMLGACSKGGPLWIIVELCEHGNLLNFLRKNRQETSGKTGDYISSLDPLLRVRIAYDVSKGMHFLEDKKIVHRDLAARNILLGKNKIAKIADFGLSRDIYEQGLYKMQAGGKLPVKWMAIESLRDQVYDSKSDVWSFGILFWEIETAGMVPYPGVGGRDVLGFLLNGFRLERPYETPFEIYEIMKKCWEPSPKVRPRFQEIESELEAYLEKNAEYLPVVIEEDQSDQEEAYINYILDVEDDETNDTNL